jgi:FlgD Ig-like domain
MSCRRFVRSVVLTCAITLMLPNPARAYGFSVHRLVNRSATTHLPAGFQGFAQWATELEDLATAADERKSSVPGESIKHYIDIDDYPEFFAGTLPQSYTAMVSQYGQSRVDGNGTVPWAIESSYQDLLVAFLNEDWTAAVAAAADLGHYVADTHSPLHLTVNYNGQLTGQNGIHSRHESQMTGQHLAELEPLPSPGSTAIVNSLLPAVFGWIDGLYPGVQLILDADLTAKTAAGGSTSGSTYYDRLWIEVGGETTTWVRDASIHLASLWYSAWVQAGSPPLPGDATAAESVPVASGTRVLANVPNPFNPSTRLRFEIAQAGSATLQIVDATGRTVRRVDLGTLGIGAHEFRWDGTDQAGRRLASGVYRVVVSDAGGAIASARAVLVK